MASFLSNSTERKKELVGKGNNFADHLCVLRDRDTISCVKRPEIEICEVLLK